MENIKIQIKSQIRFIYTKIEDVQTYNPHRTPQQARNIIACGRSRCYMLVDMCEALAKDGIISNDELIEITRKCLDASNIFTELSNNI